VKGIVDRVPFYESSIKGGFGDRFSDNDQEKLKVDRSHVIWPVEWKVAECVFEHFMHLHTST